MVIGIDLGARKACMAALREQTPVIVENAEGEDATPCVVAFDDRSWVVGSVARRQALMAPGETIYSIRDLMGRSVAEVEEEGLDVPYEIVAGPKGEVRIAVGGERYSPPEISAMILRKLKEDAEAKLGEAVDGAVVTVPAYFDDDQRQATIDAGKIAGLEVKRLINEPTAASLAYGLEREAEQSILVLDLGAGSLSVSVVRTGDGIFEVIAMAGDNHLGGDDWDKVIVDWLVARFRHDHGVDLAANKAALQRLRQAAEKAKIELSSTEETQIYLPFITLVGGQPKHLDVKLTRERLNRLASGLFERLVHPIRRALGDAREHEVEKIDHVLLVGGMTRSPVVRQKVAEITGQRARTDIDPIEANARGAALQAGVLTGQRRDVLLLDVTSLSIGIETKGGVMTKLIQRNTTIPTRVSEVFSTAEDDQQSVEIHVLQGEHEDASGNKSLGKFQLHGIPPAPRGTPQIEVVFNVEVDGLLRVSAKDRQTGERRNIDVAARRGLSDQEITDAAARITQGDALTAPSVVEKDRKVSPVAQAPTDAEHERPHRRPLNPLKLFYSYSHRDERFREELQTHLSLLRRQDLIQEWNDRMIGAGEDWEPEIDRHLLEADVVLLLVSPDFLASDYCYEREMSMALERHERGEARVLPIVLRPVDWLSPPSPIGHLQALPRDGKPIVDFRKRDSAWLEVTDGIRRVVAELLRDHPQGAGEN